MFLRKITAIKGVGRFKSCAVSGGEYKRYTLFYGGNGRGKTTLCAVLRSMQRADPGPISRRRTFGHAGDQQAQLLLDTGPINFGTSGWDGSATAIHIFDQDFIAENVHGGQQIDVDQRRAFYRIAVGPKGVALAAAVDQLDEEAAALQSALSAEARVLQQHADGMTLEAFLALPAEPDFDAAIGEARAALKAAESSAAIAGRALMQEVSLPEIPKDLLNLLGKGLEGVSADASKRVAAHLQQHQFHVEGEAWLQAGLKHAADGDCPFCGRSLEGVDLIKAYEVFFSAAYADHKTAIGNAKNAFQKAFGEAAALRVVQGFKDAEAAAKFWSEFGIQGYSTPPEAEEAQHVLDKVAKAALALLDAKIAAPLEPVQVSPAFVDAADAWTTTHAALAAANATMPTVNTSILALKEANKSTSKSTVETQLKLLLAARRRHTAPVEGIAATYKNLVAQKADVVAKKAAKKDELDAYDAEMLAQYQNAINAILTRFGAGFRVSQSSKNYMGGKPQSLFCLRFGDTDVDIAGKAAGDTPTFATTMSAGDKNTFALAFFLAQLDRDTSIADKVVVFDDPFTSLDDFRREVTAKAIVRVGKKAAQVIVLSHDKYFLDAVRQKLHGAPFAAMQISLSQDNSALAPWDIDWEVKEGYLQDHMELSDFAEGVEGEAKDMRTKMRPLLEKYIRYRFPNQIADGLWLGDMIKIIREEPAHPLKGQLSELEDINEYTAPFHHDPNTPFNTDEVMTHVKRTLAVVGGC